MTPSAHWKICAFDFDGTLIDSMWGYAEIAADAMRKHHGIPREEGHRLYLETSGIPFFQQLESIRPGSLKNAACAEEFEARKIEGMFLSKPDADALEGTRRLREAGVRLVVSSNNFQHLVERYMQQNPSLQMDLVLGFDQEKKLEKGRLHFEAIEKRFGLPKSVILYCGDSLKDGERALDYGIPFVGRTGIFSHQQFTQRFDGITTVDSICQFADYVLLSQ